MNVSAAVDAACDGFEARWRAGDVPAIEDHLAAVAPEERLALLRELAVIDAQWRRRRGEKISIAHYSSRFAELEAWPPLVEALGDSGRFELVERLGTGSFGTTWRARDARLGRMVAVKIAHGGTEPGRFEREARSASRLRHPGIATVHEAVELQGRPALVTELVDGTSLAQRLASGWRPPHAESAAIAAAIADALQHAHDLGVVHRDVKPANVVLEHAGGRAVLVDFGLARDETDSTLTAEDHVLGTPAYMSPEQASGSSRDAGPASDTYSCGAVLYHLLTGRPPFADGPALLHRVAHDQPPSPRRLDPSIPRDLATIVLKAMAKSPDGRYASAADLASDLRRFAQGRPIAARPIPAPARLWRWSRREPALALALAGMLVAAAGVTIVSVRAARAAERQRDETLRALARARSAEAARDEEAFESSLAAAEALAAADRPGRRFDALDAADLARARLAGLPRQRERARRLRSVVLAALCLPDLRPGATRILPPGTSAVDFARDGSTWARADALGAVDVLDGSGRVLASRPGPGRPVQRLSFSPDGSALAIVHRGGGGAADGFVAWRWRDAGPATEIAPAPPATAWAPDGSLLLQIEGSRVARWSPGDGAITPAPGLHGAPLAAGPKGLVALRPGERERRAEIASLLDGRVRRAIPLPDVPWTAAFEPERGDVLLLTSGPRVLLFDVATGRLRAELPSHDAPVTSSCVAPGGRWAATTGWDATTRACDLRSGRLLAVAPSPWGDPVLAFSDSGELLAHADGRVAGPFRTALDVPLAESDLGTSLGHAPGIAELSPSGDCLVAWAEPGRLGRPAAIVDPRDGSLLCRLDDPGIVAARFTTDGGSLVTSGQRGVKRWPLRRDGGHVVVGEPRILCRDPAADLDVTDERWAAAVATRRIAWGDLSREGAESIIGCADDPFTLALGRGGLSVALGTWHGKRGECLALPSGRELWSSASGSSVVVRALRSDGSILVHAGDQLRRCDAATGAIRAAIALAGGASEPSRIAVADAAGLVAIQAPSAEGAIRLLDAVTLDELATLRLPGPRGEAIAWCALDAEGRTLCVGTAKGRLLRWDLAALRDELRSRGLDWGSPDDPRTTRGS